VGEFTVLPSWILGGTKEERKGEGRNGKGRGEERKIGREGKEK